MPLFRDPAAPAAAQAGAAHGKPFPLPAGTQLHKPATFYERLAIGQHALRLTEVAVDTDKSFKVAMGLVEDSDDPSTKRCDASAV